MVNELMKLYNTLATIETKGESSITMADCLRFTKKLIDAENRRIEEENRKAAEKVQEPEVLPEE